MQRRAFLTAAAAVIPAAGFHDLVGHAAPSQAAPEPHLVGAGEDRLGELHTTAFSTLLFKVAGSETGSEMFLMEHQHMKQGGPPLHLHWNQEEWFYVMEGAVAFQVGAQRLTLKPGESVLAPRRVPHAFSSVAEGDSRMLIAFCPAGRMEQFFHDTDHAALPTNPAFWRKYEMDFVGPSPFRKA
jgi:mannose-6-phosphate isomerase-like protein (cupin superfamily)